MNRKRNPNGPGAWAGRATARSLLFILMLLASACAFVDQTPPNERVRMRSEERLALLMAAQYEQAYLYASPGYRTLETERQYESRWLGAQWWREAAVTNVDCPDTSPGRCRATVRVRFRPPGPRTSEITTHLFETWILVDGQWYLYQEI
jgi:hypothetical protein